jgi:hypothetical protein
MARSSVTPHRTPSRLPSCQSTWIVIPTASSSYDLKSSVGPTSKSQRQGKSLGSKSKAESVVQISPNQQSKKKRTRKPPSTKQCKRTRASITTKTDDNSEEVGGVTDHTQDSDKENSKFQGPSKKKTSCDDIHEYFGAPFHAVKMDEVSFCILIKHRELSDKVTDDIIFLY